MKKMTYLMMLVLGLTAVQTTNAAVPAVPSMDSIKGNAKSAGEVLKAAKEAKDKAEAMKKEHDQKKAEAKKGAPVKSAVSEVTAPAA